MREISGLALSRKHAGVFWAICDSGNLPHLYAIDRGGKLLAECRVKGATNLDWEAITTDDAGFLYVGDVGNNWTKLLPGGLSSRRVFRIREPDPIATAQAQQDSVPELTVERTYNFTYPGKSFDCEAIFIGGGEIYLISKVKNQPTKLYRLPQDKPDDSVQLVEVCKLPEFFTVTDAALSPDGRRLAVCSYRYAAMFELDPCEPIERLEQKSPSVVKFSSSTSIEGCSWEGEELILVSEERQVYSLRFERQCRTIPGDK